MTSADRKSWRYACAGTARITVDVREEPAEGFSLLRELARDPESGLKEVEPGVYRGGPGVFLR